MEISLLRASKSDAEEFFDIQKKSSQALLEKYQDYKTNPAKELFETTMKRFHNPHRDMYFICLHNKPIGIIIIAVDKETHTLIRIGILPEYQNKGYAQTSIVRVEALYPLATKWKLDTIKQEEKLCYLYEKIGYIKRWI